MISLTLTIDQDMPRCCGKCPLSVIEDVGDEASCPVIGDMTEWFNIPVEDDYDGCKGYYERHPDCKLQSVEV